jgi:N-acetylglutamate synthase-like GNAT family acetyltransferase
MDWTKEEFRISTNDAEFDVGYIHQFLSNSYWAENIPIETVRQSIKGSLSFGVFERDHQIGFARVITDHTTFAYIADVFIDESHRGKGLSKWLMEIILKHPSLQGLRRILLATRDAHGLYAQFGFTSIKEPQRWMQIHNPDVYSREKG